LTALAGASCQSSHRFISPTVDQGPPPFIGPAQIGASSDKVPSEKVGDAPAKPKVEPPAFVKTQDSNEWVRRSFKVQTKYARVIAVSAGETAPTKISVRAIDLNAPFEKKYPEEQLTVDASVKTLEEASAMAKGGDLIAVMPGRYQGFTLGDKTDAGDDKYIHFKAVGPPGAVVIDRPASGDANWMIILKAAHHVIIEGFNVAGTSEPGKRAEGPNAGIFIDGDFLNSSKLAHHIAVVGNFSHNHKKWGIHSVDSHTVLLEDNVFALSAVEHSAYISDGSDDYVIRRNVFHGSNASGLQCNVDPLASLEKLKEHPALADHPPYKKTRTWALAMLALATERFGANNFPDGRGFNYIIEDNVMTDNGRGGGAAINLAGVRESLIQNNLIYNNHASGIVEWDNQNPFDSAQVDPGPQSAIEVTGPDVLPVFGCFSNVVRNNTVLMSARGRPALLVGNGSWGTRARNNILVNDQFPSVELYSTSIWRFDAARNVLNAVKYEGAAASLRSLAISLPEANGAVLGVTQSNLSPQFVRAGSEPWIVMDGDWWKPNPRRPDFRPRAGSSLLAGRGDATELPGHDLAGVLRKTADIGAFASAER